MWSQKKPIKLIWKKPHMCLLSGRAPRRKNDVYYESIKRKLKIRPIFNHFFWGRNKFLVLKNWLIFYSSPLRLQQNRKFACNTLQHPAYFNATSWKHSPLRKHCAKQALWLTATQISLLVLYRSSACIHGQKQKPLTSSDRESTVELSLLWIKAIAKDKRYK